MSAGVDEAGDDVEDSFGFYGAVQRDKHVLVHRDTPKQCGLAAIPRRARVPGFRGAAYILGIGRQGGQQCANNHKIAIWGGPAAAGWVRGRVGWVHFRGEKWGEFFYNPTISRHFLPFGWGSALGMGVEMVGFSAVSAHFSAVSAHFFAFLGGFGGFCWGGDGGVGLGPYSVVKGRGFGFWG